MAKATLTLSAALVFISCSGSPESSEAEAWYDQPTSFPPGERFESEVAAVQSTSSQDECGRGRGFTPDGECVLLNVEKLEVAERVQIPGGKFVRGDLPIRYDAADFKTAPRIQFPGQTLRYDEVESFWIDVHEVTREAYAACLAKGACTQAVCLDGSDGAPKREMSDADRDLMPQTCVTHTQAATYCAANDARLPTEPEFEFAARGPEAWVYPWGNEFRDEVPFQGLGPVRIKLDRSWFGILGLGSNAIEWTADRYTLDEGLSPYLAGPFRDEDSPLNKAREDWEKLVTCGYVPGCEIGGYPDRFVIKGGRSGARTAGRDLGPDSKIAWDSVPPTNFEGDRSFAHHEMLGFRCAADLRSGDTPLASPKPPVSLPMPMVEGNYDVFVGVAEAVTRDEAERFCQVLRAPGDTEDEDGDAGWRLPTLEEASALQRFRGPGPFWAVEGAVEQLYDDEHNGEWSLLEAGEGEVMMARCIRSRSG